MPFIRPTPTRILALVLAAALLAPALPAAAQQIDAVLRDFQLTGDWILEIDGQTVEGAEVYEAEHIPAILVLADELSSPAILLPREGAVQTVSFMKVLKSDGTVNVMADAQLSRVGPFRFEGQQVSFTMDGRQVRLKQRPDLIGEQGVDDMLDYSPEYRRSARGYSPDADALEAIRGVDEPVRVRVYFGSWCPFCKQYVPHLLKVAQELEGAPVEFEFYGLPQGFQDEPMAKRDSVNGVPTGIVYVNGEEAGRIQANDWRNPEAAIRQIVTGS